jgi:hypothetical protein
MTKKIEAWALSNASGAFVSVVLNKPRSVRGYRLVRLVEADPAVGAVLRAAIKEAKAEPLYFSDEDGCSHRRRPSALKRAVSKLLTQREKK